MKTFKICIDQRRYETYTYRVEAESADAAIAIAEVWHETEPFEKVWDTNLEDTGVIGMHRDEWEVVSWDEQEKD